MRAGPGLVSRSGGLVGPEEAAALNGRTVPIPPPCNSLDFLRGQCPKKILWNLKISGQVAELVSNGTVTYGNDVC